MNRAERRRAQRAGKTTNPLAITWYSNAIFAETGYGTQTKQAVTRLTADGHRVAIANNYGLQATVATFDDILHYPMGTDVYSNDVIEPIFRDWSRQNADLQPLVIALFDAWPLKGPAWDRMPVGIWTMVDHLPVPPAVRDFLAKPNVTPLAASGFAQRQIEAAGVESIYVPMAIDTNLYKPTPTWSNGGTPMTGRRLMGFGDDAEDFFVVSLINANKAGGNVHRKGWAESLLAFKAFSDRHDDVRAYIHTERHGKYGGINFDMLFNALGLAPDRFRFVNQWANMVTGIPNEAMAAMYTATDVLLAPTYGEGFGLTVAEAGACETPAIVSDFTCQPELVSEDSFLVDGQVWWDNAQAAWWQIPTIASIVDALESAYARGRYRSKAQREHIVANFDADTVYEQHWKPALARMTAEPEPVATVDPIITDADAPALTIYIPTYRRPSELADLLASLMPQCGTDVEVIVADDDPEESGRSACEQWPVRYIARGENLGGDENLQRGYEESRGRWVWMVGDDDRILPGAVADILEGIRSADVDRLILLSPDAPTGAAGCEGTPAGLEALQPGLSIASTLITANVVRRSALDFAAGRREIDSMYGWAFSFAHIRRCRVLASPCFAVGTQHAGEYVQSRGRGDDAVVAVWGRLLAAQGVQLTESALSWNHVSAARAAAA